MKRIWLIPLISMFFGQSASEDFNKFPPMPPSFIDKGWLHLFDGSTTFGWKIAGEAGIDNGKLVLGGKKATSAFTTTHFGPHILSFVFHHEGQKPGEFLYNHEWRKLD